MKIDSRLVRRIRREKAWSQEQLATVAGVSLRTIQRVEADGSGSLETNMALASALGVPTIELTFEARARRPTARAALFGVVGGSAGALVGLAVGWSSLFSTSMDAADRGTAFGLVGVGSGIVIAFVAALLKGLFRDKSM